MAGWEEREDVDLAGQDCGVDVVPKLRWQSKEKADCTPVRLISQRMAMPGIRGRLRGGSCSVQKSSNDHGSFRVAVMNSLQLRDTAGVLWSRPKTRRVRVRQSVFRDGRLMTTVEVRKSAIDHVN